MPEVEERSPISEPAPTYRLDVQLHDLLMKPPKQPRLLPPPKDGKLQTLPEAVFPQYPELLDMPDEAFFPVNGRRKHKAKHVYRALRGWAFPFIRSRVLPGDFHPIIAYLFNEWKCNLDCHYCWAFDNSVRGMTEDTAKRSIDWLRDSGAGVLALMGGEPLLRPDFAHKIIYYAVKKGFWVYLPTDVVPIRKHFDSLVKKSYKYGYSVFLNINICANNMDDVRQLTELAHDNGIATDYHICESPMTEQPHFKHLYSNPTFIREKDHPAVAELIDWLIEKQKSGYHMVNSVQRLAQMKNFIHGDLEDWNCRAGHNSLIVRVDGTLAPCFPMYSAGYDWGTIENHKFDTKQLKEMKKECQKSCFSTLNHILAFCYNDRRVISWMLKQAKHGFRRIEGNFGD